MIFEGQKKILSLGLVIAVCITTCCYYSYWLGGTSSPFISFNSSLFGVLIVAFGLLIMPAFKRKALFFSFSIVVFVMIAFTGSRLGLLAWIMGVFFTGWFNGLFKSVKPKILLSIADFGFSALFIGLVFLFKTDSTQGRWFIWQNCFAIIKEYWLTGVGLGQFRVAYNTEQANWFMKHGFQNKETMLADTVYYSFNEWLQLAVESGLPISLSLLSVLLFVTIRAFKNVFNSDRSYTEIKVLAAFSTLLFSTFFSYPFFYLPTLLLFIILFLWVIKIARFSFIERLPLIVKRVALFLVVGLVALFLSKQFYARLQWKQANELHRVGYKKQALVKMKKTYHTLSSNGDYLFTLATIYSSLNKTDSALFFMEKSAITKNDYELHRKLGQLFMETGNQRLAEEHFLKAVYMVPNRFRSREMLVDFYHHLGKSNEARYWAGLTIQLKVKVPSHTSGRVKARMEKYLEKGIW